MVANWSQYLFLSGMGSGFALMTGVFAKVFINSPKISKKESDKIFQEAWIILR